MYIHNCTAYFNNLSWQNNSSSLRKDYNTNQISFCAKVPVKSRNMIRDILAMFTQTNYKLPYGLTNIKKASDKTLLSFEKVLGNGKKLIVNKQFPDRNNARTPYMIIQESGNREPIGVELQKGNIIYLDKSSHKPIFKNGKFQEIPFSDKKHAEHAAKLEEWLKEIFPEQSSANSKVTKGFSRKSSQTLPDVSAPPKEVETATTSSKKIYIPPTININSIRYQPIPKRHQH